MSFAFFSARSGQNCGANSGTGSAKRSCCQCCKDGQAAGLKEESCDRQITQATSLLTGLCTLSFKSCCEDAKKKKTQGAFAYNWSKISALKN